MTCPDLASLGRAGTTRADPTVVEHLRKCQSCWLDWQIQQGARYLVQDDSEGLLVSTAQDRKVMALIRATTEDLDRPAGWVELGLSAILTALAAVIFLVIKGHGVGTSAVAAGYVIASGIVGGLYCWRRDKTLGEWHGP